VPGRGGLKDELAERTPVGVTMTLDDEYGTMVGKEGDRRAARAFGDRVRMELAKVLDVPLTCVEISGVHRGSIIVDFNIIPPEDSPRTARQLFATLSAMVGDDGSPLHTEVQAISRAVRVLMRGSTHDIYERQKNKAEVEDTEAKEAKAAELAEDRTPTPQKASLVHLDDEPSASPVRRSPAKRDSGMAAALMGGGGGLSALAKVVKLQQEAKDLQVGFRNKKFFYSVGKQRRGPAEWREFVGLFNAATVTKDSYVWYKAMGKEWKRLSDQTDLLEAVRAKTEEDLNSVEKENALREVSAIRMQRFIRGWLAYKRDENAYYDEEDDIAAFERAPSDFPAPESRQQTGDASKAPSRGPTTRGQTAAAESQGESERPEDAEEPAANEIQRVESSPIKFSRLKSLADKPGTAAAGQQRPATKKLKLGEEEEEEEALQKTDAAMMLSLAGIMMTTRGLLKGSVLEQDAIRSEMDQIGVHNDEEQQQADSLLVKDFVDGAMYTLEMVFMGSEEESAAIIAEKFEEQARWNELVSEVEDQVLGGSLEDDLDKREQEWGPAGEEAKTLRKTIEKLAKKKKIAPPRNMTKSDWRDAKGRQGVGQLADRVNFQ